MSTLDRYLADSYRRDVMGESVKVETPELLASHIHQPLDLLVVGHIHRLQKCNVRVALRQLAEAPEVFLALVIRLVGHI